ncbi:MAG: hypothetical protein ACK4GN_01245 [Runella sp.]
MRNTYWGIVFGVFFTFSASAQNTPNPDAPPPTTQEEGPIKVLREPPRRQEQPARPPSALDRLRLGGSIGPFNFGTITSLGISPVAGLQLTERLSLGGGLSYQYTSIRFNRNSRSTFNNYGGRAFAMFNVIPNINLNAEYESLNVQYRDNNNSGVPRRTWLNSAMIGASYSTPTGGRFIRAFNLMFLYNLNYNQHTNPTNPNENIYPTGSPLVIRAVLF